MTEPTAEMVKTITANMTLVYIAGAAREDATPEQLALLKELTEDARDISIPLKDVAASIFGIMGPTWVPGPKWMDAIKSMNGDKT